MAAPRETPCWRILIVDNEEGTRQEHWQNLQGEGYEVFLATGRGQDLLNDARVKAAKLRCHLAVVDMRLLDDGDRTDTSGLGLVEELKPAESIIVTGFADRAYYSEEARKKGALHILDKGDPTELRNMVRGTLDECGYRDMEIEWKATLNELRVARHLFPENPGLFRGEAEDVLRRLFPRAEGLEVTLLDAVDDPLSLTLRPGSLVVKVTERGKDLPYLVKLGRSGRIGTEVLNYDEHIRMQGPAEAPVAPLKTHGLWTLGGTVYNYVGNFTHQRPTLFSDWYKAPERGVRDIDRALHALYEQWRPHYHRRLPEASSPAVAYSAVWDRNKDGDTWLARLVSRRASLSGVNCPPALCGMALPNPVTWLIARLAIASDGSYLDPTALQANLSITHGDLHGDNLFVTLHSDVWVIDFERTGRGHVLQDWVELEHDVLTRLTPLEPGDWPHYARLACAAAGPDVVSSWSAAQLRSLSRRIRHPQARKSLKVINTIRGLARESEQGSGDARPYMWGLLLNATFRMMIWQAEHDEARLPEEDADRYSQRRQKLHAGIQRCFVLAGVLCHRLDNWNTSWPPKEWALFLKNPE